MKHNIENSTTAAIDGQALLLHSICQFLKRHVFVLMLLELLWFVSSGANADDDKKMEGEVYQLSNAPLFGGRLTEATLEEHGGTCSVGSMENVFDLRKSKKKKIGNEADEGKLDGVMSRLTLSRSLWIFLETIVQSETKSKDKKKRSTLSSEHLNASQQSSTKDCSEEDELGIAMTDLDGKPRDSQPVGTMADQEKHVNKGYLPTSADEMGEKRALSKGSKRRKTDGSNGVRAGELLKKVPLSSGANGGVFEGDNGVSSPTLYTPSTKRDADGASANSGG
ncbi:hypothetical protein Ancab_027830 [Ancistrocladus abbreviatus]